MISRAPTPSAATASTGTGAAATEDFNAFYRREYEAIVRIAWSVTGRRDVAEELAQESFLAAHRSWPRVAAMDNPGAWMRRVTINRSISALRRGATEVRGLGRLGRERRAEIELPDSTNEVWRALRTLPRRQIEALVLVVVEDRSVPEVAAILDCGEQTVRTHLRRGRRQLAAVLGAQEADDDDAR